MATDSTYWSKRSDYRFNRRLLLKSGLSVGAVGAIGGLFGCGPGSGHGGGSTDASGLLYKPADTTSKAVKGGNFQSAQNLTTVQSLEPLTGLTGAGFAMQAYSRLVKYEAFKYPTAVRPSVVPDAAASWETSPDGLVHTYRLRPNFKFDSRPPTNGRPLTAADVKFTFDKFGTSPLRSQLLNQYNPDSAIESVNAVDDTTVVIKTAFRYAPLEAMLGSNRYIGILPVEAYDKFDPRKDMRATGAWRLKEFLPSTRLSLTKNTDWYDADKIFFDSVEYPNVVEYATGEAQFRAGNLGTYPIHQEEVLSTKKSLSSLLMKPQEDFPLAPFWIRYGFLQGSPFRDQRVRQALSMLIDRDLWVATFGNVDAFTKAGLTVPARWNTSIPSGEEGYWLDPKNAKDFGENAKYFEHNPSEAKKLMRAAGFTQPLEAKLSYQTGKDDIARWAAVLQGMWESNSDFKLKPNVIDYLTDFAPNITNGFDKHDGIAINTNSSYPEVDGWLSTFLTSGQPRSGHLDADGNVDSVLDGLVTKQRQEPDANTRVGIIKDIQRHVAGKAYLMFEPGNALGFDLAWPWLRNWGLYRSRAGGVPAQETLVYNWLDTSLKS